jgi:hypothetical protein
LKTWGADIGWESRTVCLQPLALLNSDANNAGCSLDIPLEDESIRFQANSLRHNSAGQVSIHNPMLFDFSRHRREKKPCPTSMRRKKRTMKTPSFIL